MENIAKYERKERVRSIFRVAFPLIVQALVFQLQSLTDKAFLGNLDTKYMSAVGAAQMPFYTLVDSMGAITVGLVIVISNLYGAGEKEKINTYVKSTAFYNMLVGTSIFFLWAFAAEPVLAFFKTDIEIIGYSATYNRICAYYMLVFGFDCALQSMLQGLGDTKPIMVAGMLKVGLNVVISWVLIFGKLGFPALHVTGAAIGTLVANLISFAFIVVYCLIVKRKELQLNKLDRLWFNIKPYGKVIKLGVPVALEYLLWNASNLMLIRYINSFSYIAMGIYTLTFGLELVIYVVFDAVSKSTLTLMGQSIGGKDYKRANGLFYNSIVINFLIVLVSALCFWIFPEFLLGIFSNDADLIVKSVPYLALMALIMFPQSINVICGNGIRAHGNTRWMLFSQVLGSTMIVTISFFLIEVLHMNMIAIYATIFLDESIRGIINYIYYRKKYGYHEDKNVLLEEN